MSLTNTCKIHDIFYIFHAMKHGYLIANTIEYVLLFRNSFSMNTYNML